jgi:hypothetical protein
MLVTYLKAELWTQKRQPLLCKCGKHISVAANTTTEEPCRQCFLCGPNQGKERQPSRVSQSHQAVKYGHESHGTLRQESMLARASSSLAASQVSLELCCYMLLPSNS